MAIFIKRDDLTSSIYGGNKVRTLEPLFGIALRSGARRIYATGAFGSNHAVATVLHARRVGLTAGALLFPQPASETALDNLRVVIAHAETLHALPHWSFLPPGIAWLRRKERREHARPPYVMVPGGAVPEGALGYVSAAFELAEQLQAQGLQNPRAVIIGVGSTCTSAGLLLGFTLAARMGIGFVGRQNRPEPPQLVSVRVTPWPVTSRYRIIGLAVRTSRLLARLAGDARLELSRRELDPLLTIDGGQLGSGYGHPTRAGLGAIELFRDSGGPELDTTYSAKSAAALIDRVRAGEPGPLLYWATKSTGPLPHVEPECIERAAPAVRRWIRRVGHRTGK